MSLRNTLQGLPMTSSLADSLRPSTFTFLALYPGQASTIALLGLLPPVGDINLYSGWTLENTSFNAVHKLNAYAEGTAKSLW